MSFTMSLVQTIARLGFAPNLASAWLTSFAIGVAVAIPTAILRRSEAGPGDGPPKNGRLWGLTCPRIDFTKSQCVLAGEFAIGIWPAAA
jgi:Protein of unknown function (DUF2798)